MSSNPWVLVAVAAGITGSVGCVAPTSAREGVGLETWGIAMELNGEPGGVQEFETPIGDRATREDVTAVFGQLRGVAASPDEALVEMTAIATVDGVAFDEVSVLAPLAELEGPAQAIDDLVSRGLGVTADDMHQEALSVPCCQGECECLHPNRWCLCLAHVSRE